MPCSSRMRGNSHVRFFGGRVSERERGYPLDSRASMQNITSNDQVLIWLEERHASNIFAGTKRVELRRRAMHVSNGTVVWIYVKCPVGSVLGQAVVAATHILTPNQIWQKFGSCLGLARAEFFDYCEGLRSAFILELKDAKKMKEGVPLNALRDASTTFHPPQFFVRVDPTSSLAALMSAGMPKSEGPSGRRV
ncbi:Transcriptional regulator, Cro/CI family [Candidatus Burkholderia verschuerenii]|uniref:Transcriptional regulator, Cro/CI family n=1 Tax=Candidatus Burkholderia verschuerenii TaxID=242163 RepID=A0A0L0M892_9BURK|nr:Transcriptional regulator, Cro/CI family [Candidatus Burkholderia verschuerenii]